MELAGLGVDFEASLWTSVRDAAVIRLKLPDCVRRQGKVDIARPRDREQPFKDRRCIASIQ